MNSKQSKDYELAFATLSSSYGFGGGAPSLPPRQTKKKKDSVGASPSSYPSPRASYPSNDLNDRSPSRSHKDYEGAFAYLSSSFGFGGNGPRRKT